MAGSYWTSSVWLATMRARRSGSWVTRRPGDPGRFHSGDQGPPRSPVPSDAQTLRDFNSVVGAMGIVALFAAKGKAGLGHKTAKTLLSDLIPCWSSTASMAMPCEAATWARYSGKASWLLPKRL